MNALILLLSSMALPVAALSATLDGAPPARLPRPGDGVVPVSLHAPVVDAAPLRLAQSMAACNPRVRLCDAGEAGAEKRDRADSTDARKSKKRSWLRGTLACNPRVRICDE